MFETTNQKIKAIVKKISCMIIIHYNINEKMSMYPPWILVMGLTGANLLVFKAHMPHFARNMYQRMSPLTNHWDDEASPNVSQPQVKHLTKTLSAIYHAIATIFGYQVETAQPVEGDIPPHLKSSHWPFTERHPKIEFMHAIHLGVHSN